MNIAKGFLNCIRINQWFVSKRFAGHSKWANIKHTKAANDGAKSKLFARFTQRIKICIQENGDTNPDTNKSLANLIESAKKHSMPVSSIQNAIKIAQVNKSKMEECMFEIKGPKGCFIIALAITDNWKKTKDTLSTILRKNKVSFAENVIKTMFCRKAVIEAVPPDNIKEMDQVLEHAIDASAEDVVQTESNTFLFYSDPAYLEKTKQKLEDLSYKIIEAEDHFIANSHVSLSDSELIAVGNLCDKLEEHPDVIKLYDNIA